MRFNLKMALYKYNLYVPVRGYICNSSLLFLVLAHIQTLTFTDWAIDLSGCRGVSCCRLSLRTKDFTL